MSSPRAEHAQTLAGRYRVVRPLGSGGMASVVLAEDERLGRLVAVKRLHTSSPEDALARFRREARLGASLNHPNVVSIYDSTTDEDSLLIVMEYVEGESLKDQLRKGPLPAERVAAVIGQIGSALDYAHAAGVIHRDVKPSNVLIAADDTAKLADLGIATATDVTSITTANDIIGTLSYIAPERLESAPDDPSADVFSLAAVAFEALSGQKAQPGQTPTEIVTGGVRQLHEAWPGAPAGAAEVLSDGLARDPQLRPSAGELARRLSAALGGEAPAPVADPEATTRLVTPAPASAPPPAAAQPPAAPTGGWSRRRTALAVLVAGLLGAGIAIAAISGGDDDPAPQTQAQNPPAKPKPKTPEPEPEPLTGAALGAELNDQGFALLEQGSVDEAISVLRQSVDAFPDGSTDITYAFALYNLAHALRLAGQPQEAIPLLEERLALTSNQRGVVKKELAQAQSDAGFDASGGVTPGDEEDEGDGGSGSDSGNGGGSGGGGASGGVGPGGGES